MPPLTIGLEAQRVFRDRRHGMDVVAVETIKRLARRFAEADQGDRVVAFVKPGPDVCLESGPGLDVVEVAGGPYPVWEQRALPRAARAAGVDLLHCTSNTAPLKPGVPLVVTLHDVIFLEGAPLQAGGSAYQRVGNLYRRWNVPRAVRRADAVVTVSHYERTRIERTLPALKGRLEVVYNGVSEAFRPVTDPALKDAVRARYGLPERFVFFLGNTAPKKNLPRVVEAWARYAHRVDDPAALVVADYPLEPLQAQLAGLGLGHLGSRIVAPGYLAHADLPAVYAQAEAFLYPSLRESFGLPILEAMACGCPVLTASAASMPEVAGDAALLADPTDAPALADALIRLLTDGALRARLAALGPARAAAFSWDHAAASLDALYRRVLAAKAPAERPERSPRAAPAHPATAPRSASGSPKADPAGPPAPSLPEPPAPLQDPSPRPVPAA